MTQEPAPVVTEPISADVERAVLRAEQNLDAVERNSDTGRVGAGSGYHGNDILPEAAEEMGPGTYVHVHVYTDLGEYLLIPLSLSLPLSLPPEALVRFLKAKLRVMQEEVDRLCQELAAKVRKKTLSLLLSLPPPPPHTHTHQEKQLTSSQAKVKELSDQNSTLQRTHHTVQVGMTTSPQPALLVVSRV